MLLLWHSSTVPASRKGHSSPGYRPGVFWPIVCKGRRAAMAVIVPSILSADFARLGEQVRAAAAGGADRIQIDVMDGRFVPNITVGPLIVEAVRRHCALPLEAHLMIVDPERYVQDFATAGADTIIVHPAVSPHFPRTGEQLHPLGRP